MIVFEAASLICSLSTSSPSSSMNEAENKTAILQDIQPPLSVLQLLWKDEIVTVHKLSTKYPHFVAGRLIQ